MLLLTSTSSGRGEVTFCLVEGVELVGSIDLADDTRTNPSVANHPRTALKVAAEGGFGTPPYTARRETLSVPYKNATKHKIQRPSCDDDDDVDDVVDDDFVREDIPLMDGTRSSLGPSCVADNGLDVERFDVTSSDRWWILPSIGDDGDDDDGRTLPFLNLKRSNFVDSSCCRRGRKKADIEDGRRVIVVNNSKSRTETFLRCHFPVLTESLMLRR